jgi:hypothetical protein
MTERDTGLWCRITVVGPDGAVVTERLLRTSGPPDLGTVNEVARHALAARRLGGAIVLHEVAPALRELLELSGLTPGVVSDLSLDELPVEMDWEPEGREEPLGVERGEEEAHPGDLPS